MNNTVGPTSQQPDESDGKFEMHAAQPAVTRISRKALLLVGIFGASLGLVVLMVGFGDHSTTPREGQVQENTVRPSGPIESVKDLPPDYSFDVNRLGPSYERSGKPLIPNTMPTTQMAGTSAQDQSIADALRDMAEQRRKLLEQQMKEQQAAFDSPLLFGSTRSVGSSTAASSGPTSRPALASLAQDALRAALLGTQDRGARDSSANPGQQQEKEAFLTQAAAVEPYLFKPLLSPISKYELKAGSVIPGALVTAINTDLPGEVIAQVTENVYDSATGNYLLVPQGSKLLGKYQSLVSNGQNRALLVWQRLIYPNGNSITLDGMPATDESGMAGLADKVDYHLDKLAEAALLTTALAYAGNLARNPSSNTAGSSAQDVIGDTVAQQANRLGEKIIDRELDVQPTITIRQGWPLRVLVNKDMVLQPFAESQ